MNLSPSDAAAERAFDIPPDEEIAALRKVYGATDMRERFGAALCYLFGEGRIYARLRKGYDLENKDDQAFWRVKAYLAILALQNPSDEMLDAYCSVAMHTNDDDLVRGYNAMIRSAAGESPVG